MMGTVKSKTNGETECWVCRRTAKELLPIVLNLFESGDVPFETDGYSCCFSNVKIMDLKMCQICYEFINGSLGLGLHEQLISIKDLAKVLAKVKLILGK